MSKKGKQIIMQVASDDDDVELESKSNRKASKQSKSQSYMSEMTGIWIDFCRIQEWAKDPVKLFNCAWKKLRVRYMFFSVAHFAGFLVSMIFICLNKNLGAGMSLETEVEKIIPVTNPSSELQGSLNAGDTSVGGFPITIFVPIYHAIYCVYWGYIGFFGSDYFEDMYDNNLNSSRYYVNIIVMSLISVSLAVLLGLRNVISLITLIGLVAGINFMAFCIDAMIVFPRMYMCSMKSVSSSTSAAEEVSSEGTTTGKSETAPLTKSLVCRKNKEHPKILLCLKHYSLNAFGFLCIVFVVYFFAQIGLTYSTLPSWLKGLAIALTLYVALCSFFFMTWAKKKYNTSAERQEYFLSGEQRYIWISTLATVIYTIVLMVYVHKYAN